MPVVVQSLLPEQDAQEGALPALHHQEVRYPSIPSSCLISQFAERYVCMRCQQNGSSAFRSLIEWVGDHKAYAGASLYRKCFAYNFTLDA